MATSVVFIAFLSIGFSSSRCPWDGVPFNARSGIPESTQPFEELVTQQKQRDEDDRALDNCTKAEI